MKTRTHVLLHPYGTADGFKQVLASTDAAKVKRCIDGYHRAGWAGYIYCVRAASFQDAVQACARQINSGVPT